jgi:hypothetical protein
MRPEHGDAYRRLEVAGGVLRSVLTRVSVSRRRRRLTLVLAPTPGAVLVMLLAPALRSGPLLAAGVAMILAAWFFARALERHAAAALTAPSPAAASPDPNPAPPETVRC